MRGSEEGKRDTVLLGRNDKIVSITPNATSRWVVSSTEVSRCCRSLMAFSPARATLPKTVTKPNSFAAVPGWSRRPRRAVRIKS